MVKIEAQEMVDKVKEELRKEYGEDVELDFAVISIPDSAKKEPGDYEA